MSDGAVIMMILAGLGTCLNGLIAFIVYGIKEDIKHNRDTNEDQEKRLVKLETLQGIKSA